MELLADNARRFKRFAQKHASAYRELQYSLPDYSLDEDRCAEYVRRVGQAGGAAAAEKIAAVLAAVHYITARELIAALDRLVDILNANKPPGIKRAMCLPSWAKSNMWVSVIAAERLDFDFFFASLCPPKSPFYDELNELPNDVEGLPKGIEILLFDDCSYSGVQLSRDMDTLLEGRKTDVYACVPYVHRKYVMDELIHPLLREEVAKNSAELVQVKDVIDPDSPPRFLDIHPWQTLTYLQVKLPDVASFPPALLLQVNPFSYFGNKEAKRLYDNIMQKDLNDGKPRSLMRACDSVKSIWEPCPSGGYKELLSPFNELEQCPLLTFDF